ncbi:MAG: tetratricopeptide repeat protein [Pseudodesulfovibrio sp.]|nr:tetratricopeptide repeat protein [Pseudodesulfovibrio sp.]
MFKTQVLLKEKKPVEAARIIDQYLETTNENAPAEAYILLGAARHQAGDTERTLRAFLQGHERYPQNEHLCLNSAVVLYEQEQYSKAGKLFEKAFILTAPPKPELLYQAGAAYYTGGNYKKAAQVMNKLFSMSVEHKKEWTRLAIHSFIEAGLLERAQTVLMTLLEKRPNDAAYWELLAKVHMDREQYAQAAGALGISYRLKNASTAEMKRLANLYIYVDSPLKAANALQQAYGTNRTPEQASQIASLYASAGRIDKALETLNKTPNDSTKLLLEKAKILYMARRFDEASKVLSTSLKLSPGNAEAHFYNALCAWEQKHWKTAKQEFNCIVKNKDFQNHASNALAALEDLENAKL